MKLHKMLVAVDGSPPSSGALDFALNLAKAHNVELRIAYALNRGALAARACGPYGSIDPYPLLKAVEEEADAILASAEARALSAGVSATVTLLDGPATGELLAKAIEWRVDAIAIGTHGRSGVSRLAFGSVAEGVLRASGIPVFVIPEDAIFGASMHTVLAAVDGSEASAEAARYAVRLAAAEEARIVFCAVVDPGVLRWSRAQYSYAPEQAIDDMKLEAIALLNHMLEGARDTNVAATSLLRCGNTADEILQAAKDVSADLIAIGTHGRTGLGRLFLGSVAESVLRGSGVPICAIHPAPPVWLAARLARDVAMAG